MLCDRVLLRGYLQKTHILQKDLVDASILELSYQVGGASGERSQSL